MLTNIAPAAMTYPQLTEASLLGESELRIRDVTLDNAGKPLHAPNPPLVC